MQEKNNKDIQIEEIPNLVKSGKLSRTEAGKILWQEIYFNPALYGIEDLSEDARSDFLLKHYRKICQLPDDFIPGATKFRTFIRVCIVNSKRPFKRQLFEKSLQEKFINVFQNREYENTLNEYNKKNAEENLVAQGEPASYAKRLRLSGRRRQITKDTLLILLLKSCREASDSMIEKISKITGRSCNEIYSMLEKVKGDSEKRFDRQRTFIERRNSSFFLKGRATIAKNCTKPGTAIYGRFCSQYEKQAKRYKRQKKLLQGNFQPSNSSVAQNLGISPRSISFYLKHADRILKNEEADSSEK